MKLNAGILREGLTTGVVLIAATMCNICDSKEENDINKSTFDFILYDQKKDTSYDVPYAHLSCFLKKNIELVPNYEPGLEGLQLIIKGANNFKKTVYLDYNNLNEFLKKYLIFGGIVFNQGQDIRPKQMTRVKKSR